MTHGGLVGDADLSVDMRTCLQKGHAMTENADLDRCIATLERLANLLSRAELLDTITRVQDEHTAMLSQLLEGQADLHRRVDVQRGQRLDAMEARHVATNQRLAALINEVHAEVHAGQARIMELLSRLNGEASTPN